MEIGEKIKQLRTKKHRSQEALASQLNVSRQAVTKWENNLSLPSTANLLVICQVLGVSMDEMLSVDIQKKLNRKMILPIISMVFMVVSFITLVAYQNNQLPEQLIGYADEKTHVFVSGTPPFMYVLFGFTAILISVTLLTLLKNKQKWKVKKDEK